ncbi:hypothetical protein TrRE_jg8317 [Triparma retinervis]|uniref:RanBP2-type domain-containing protein n=1 Tax=Triparma retinervis TaxID=2557542 RepID=A0A9W7ARQ2_9STRA|nr:hypothetical protein TrRE_jg8317 [Triparma retinervis]
MTLPVAQPSNQQQQATTASLPTGTYVDLPAEPQHVRVVVEQEQNSGFPGAGMRRGPGGHLTVFCESCSQSYQLPNGCNSWRCQTCGKFNSTSPDECPCCTVS